MPRPAITGCSRIPAFIGQSGALAVDGLASITPQASVAQYIQTFTVGFTKGDTVTFDPSLAVEVSGSVASGGSVPWNSFPATPPTAPVAGTIAGADFATVAGQINEDSNTITVATGGVFHFGWTGLNPASQTVNQSGSITTVTGWVNDYTNKTNADDFAVVAITNSLEQTVTMTARADLDGEWETGSGAELGNGTYTVTMQDYVPSTGDPSEPGAPVTAVSDRLLMTVNDGGNPTPDNSVVVMPCFRQGTRIATPEGAVAVEALAVGARVMTVGGAAPTIRWIGRREVDCARHCRPRVVWPVRIAAGAFGVGAPCRDLFLSPDHAVFADGVLIPVKYLVNGASIAQIKVAHVTYFHVELARHDVVLAEGLPVESYLDTGDRASFGGSGDVVALFPAWGGEARDVVRIMEAVGYAPLHVTGPVVEALKRRLAGVEQDVSVCSQSAR